MRRLLLSSVAFRWMVHELGSAFVSILTTKTRTCYERGSKEIQHWMFWKILHNRDKFELEIIQTSVKIYSSREHYGCCWNNLSQLSKTQHEIIYLRGVEAEERLKGTHSLTHRYKESLQLVLNIVLTTWKVERRQSEKLLKSVSYKVTFHSQILT